MCALSIVVTGLCLLCAPRHDTLNAASEGLRFILIFGGIQLVLLMFSPWRWDGAGHAIFPGIALFSRDISWGQVLWAVAVGGGTAYLSRGHHRRWVRHAWLVFCVFSGMGGLISYLLFRKWVRRQKCPACEFKRRLSLLPCPHCGFPLSKQTTRLA